MTEQERIETKLKLESQFKNGASWFYWIAALSFINTVVLLLFDGSWSFISGLGITQVIDGFAYYVLIDFIGEQIIYYALIINLLIIGIFVALGIFANKKIKWVFILGMVLYSLDTLIFIFLTDFISIAFHIFALYSIYKGLKACSELTKLENITFDFTPEYGVTTENLVD